MEASLVVGIIVAYLVRTGRKEGALPVLWGAGGALLVSYFGYLVIVGLAFWRGTRFARRPPVAV